MKVKLALMLVIVCLPPALVESAWVKWTFETHGDVHSSPAIGVDGMVYFGSSDDRIYKVDQNRRLRWKYSTQGNISSVPAIGADGTVYVKSDYNKLYALKNGDYSVQFKWAYDTGGDLDSTSSYNFSSSPAIGADGTVYVGGFDNRLYALNPDGSLQWSYETGDWVESSPAIALDGTVYVGSDDGRFYALNPDGSLKWSYQTGGKIVASPAIGWDGTVYIGSEDRMFYALNADGTLKWSYQTGGKIRSSPAIGVDGTVYVGTTGEHDLYALNSAGGLKWMFHTSWDIISSPAISADGTVLVGSRDGKLYAVNSDGTHKWYYPTPGYMYSSPAIGADGIVYVGSSDNKLYALVTKCGGLAKSAWPIRGNNPQHTGRASPKTVVEGNINIPQQFVVSANYPNPFNPFTSITLDLPVSSEMTVTIFNTLGCQVRQLHQGELLAGRHRMKCDATDDEGVSVGSGVYILQVSTKEALENQKMTLIR